MITEIMGFLIVLGAVIVVLVRWQSRRENPPAEVMHQDMQYATQQLKQELERTGSEITSRMEQYVMNLEQLIHEADRRKSILEGRIVELRELVKLGDEQMDALHTLRSEIVEARQLCQQLSDAEGQMSSMIRGQAAGAGSIDESNFSEMLNRSMMQGSSAQAYPSYSVQAAPVSYDEPAHVTMMAHERVPQQEVKAEPVEQEVTYTSQEGETEPVREQLQEEAVATESARVRALLMNGWSVEDVARETGMGKGAVELMKEMMRRQTMS